MNAATYTIPSAPASTAPADVIAWQKERMAAGQFEILGKIWMINLEASAGAHVPGKSVSDMLGSRMEFYNDMGGPDVIGPRIAQTGARGQLLILDPIVRHDGRVGLPDIPDPKWQPKTPSNDELTGKVAMKPQRAPMIPQNIIDRGDGFGGRARGQITAGASTYLVCGPVVQIVVRPMDNQQRILPNGLIFKCLPSSTIAGVKGTDMELLIDANTGEAFLYGGRFEISNPG
jgi:hypothetical protein